MIDTKEYPEIMKTVEAYNSLIYYISLKSN